MAAVGAAEEAHVLDQTQHGHLGLFEHCHAAASVDQRDVLRGGDDHRAGQRHPLRHGQLRIAGAGRHVDDQHIQLAPDHLAEHLLQRAHHHWAAPDHRGVFFHQEADRHGLQPPGLQRQHLVAAHLRLAVEPEHARQAGTIDVGIQQADLQPLPRQRHRQIDRHGGLADAALAGRDRDDRADIGQQQWRLGVTVPACRGSRRCRCRVRGQHRGRVGHAGLAPQQRLGRRPYRLHRSGMGAVGQ